MQKKKNTTQCFKSSLSFCLGQEFFLCLLVNLDLWMIESLDRRNKVVWDIVTKSFYYFFSFSAVYSVIDWMDLKENYKTDGLVIMVYFSEEPVPACWTCILNLHICVLNRHAVWYGSNSAQCVDLTRMCLQLRFMYIL
jgi:hypothetical protein